MTEQTAPPPSHPESNKQRVERHLRELRNSHRLAIHVWEDATHMQVTGLSWNTLNEVPAAKIDSHLRRGVFPLLSLSLLPSDAAGVSMLPYNIGSNMLNEGAYLINLSQEQAHSPRIVKASLGSLGSGGEPKRKKLRLDQQTCLDILPEFYRQFGGRKKEILKAMGGEKGREYTELQLDALGQYYEDPNSEMGRVKDNIVGFNEVLAATSVDHITAIAIPFYANRLETDDRLGIREYEPAQRLCAAILGMNHLKKGLDVPVVYYRVSAPDESRGPACRDGDCIYLAQGQQELYRLAYDAIKAFIPLKPEQIDRDLLYETRRLFGYDLEKPLSSQREAFEKLRRLATNGPETLGKGASHLARLSDGDPQRGIP